MRIQCVTIVPSRSSSCRSTVTAAISLIHWRAGPPLSPLRDESIATNCCPHRRFHGSVALRGGAVPVATVEPLTPASRRHRADRSEPESQSENRAASSLRVNQSQLRKSPLSVNRVQPCGILIFFSTGRFLISLIRKTLLNKTGSRRCLAHTVYVFCTIPIARVLS